MKNRWQDALPKPVAFVFSGGAALGAIQVGMLRALTAVNLQPDLIVGTSVGALNGALVADLGPAAATEMLEDLWRSLTRKNIFPGGRRSWPARRFRACSPRWRFRATCTWTAH